MIRSTLLAALLLGIAGASTAQTATAPVKKPAASAPEPMVGQLMVKLRAPTASERVQRLGVQRVSALSKSAGLALESVRPMAGEATVMRLPQPMSLSQAQAVIDRLRADPEVEWVAPDLPVRRQQTQVPPDQGFATLQWNLFAPTTQFPALGGGSKLFVATGGANLPPAWSRSLGSLSVTVAVIDTGVTGSQRDLVGRVLPGYDFVSSGALTSLGVPENFVGNDSQPGRDADASDPGDWVTASEKSLYPRACDDGLPGSTASSWHGTHMAGIVAAQWGTDVDPQTGVIRPGTRIAGIAPGIRILPIRALGKCGGTSVDVIDAIYWAAGLPVPGVPANPNPARVLNLSLGGDAGACSASGNGRGYLEAVTAARNAGAVVVAAAGNDAVLDGVLRPANCPGVIAVTAHSISGDNADYANVGNEVAISAPGGGFASIASFNQNPELLRTDDAFVIWSTGLFGETTPTSTASGTSSTSGDALIGLTGTSPATPHVAAAAALLLSISPNLTADQVRALIIGNARPHPQGGYCSSAQGSGKCGAGLLDVGRAAAALDPPPPPPSGGGGGSLPMAPLLLFALSLARQVRRRGER